MTLVNIQSSIKKPFGVFLCYYKNMKISFYIGGQVVSQKNSKQIAYNKRTGKAFIMSSKRVQDWKKSSEKYLYNIPRIDGPVEITMTFFNQDRRKRDIDNLQTSVLDLLKNNLIIEDDNCFIVQKISSIFGGIDKTNPRVEVLIKSLDKNEF